MKRWIPEPGENYYYITSRGTLCSRRAGDLLYDNALYWRLSIGNVFKNYKGCTTALVRYYAKFNIPNRMVGGKPVIDQYWKVIDAKRNIK